MEEKFSLLEELGIAAKIVVGLKKRINLEENLDKFMVLGILILLCINYEDNTKICIKKILSQMLNTIFFKNLSNFFLILLMVSSIKGNSMEKQFLVLNRNR
jgi:hypothetical protein